MLINVSTEDIPLSRRTRDNLLDKQRQMIRCGSLNMACERVAILRDKALHTKLFEKRQRLDRAQKNGKLYL
jgi:hypothetical protein